MRRYHCAVTRVVDVLFGLDALDTRDALHNVSAPSSAPTLELDIHVPGGGRKEGGSGGGGDAVNSSVLWQWTHHLSKHLSTALEHRSAGSGARPAQRSDTKQALPSGAREPSPSSSHHSTLNLSVACGLVSGGWQGAAQPGAHGGQGWQQGGGAGCRVVCGFLCRTHLECARCMWQGASAGQDARSCAAGCLHRCSALCIACTCAMPIAHRAQGIGQEKLGRRSWCWGKCRGKCLRRALDLYLVVCASASALRDG